MITYYKKVINGGNQIMKKGILLVNVGTPASTEPRDISKYLNEFLSDPRVIDIPWLARFMLIQLTIIPKRPKRISGPYKKIWMAEGSPLLVYGKKITEELQKQLGDSYQVELAMRYGEPSIEKALKKFKHSEFKEIKVIPLFPQYASASTATVTERIMDVVKKWTVIPSIEFKTHFYDNEDYLNACAEIGKKYLSESYDHFLFSFHGIPERQIKAGDYDNACSFDSCCEKISGKNQYCYRAQCFQTAYSIAGKLGFSKENYSISFQSRLGKTPWIKPYTDHILKDFADKGYKKILVFCPSFISDCLETSYEVSVEYDNLFKSLGGTKIQLVESLNANPLWIQTLKNMVSD